MEIIIYSKKSCHLCDVAKEVLFRVQKEFPFSIIEIDIEKDIKLFEKYKYLIPVVEINGKIAFNYKIDEKELKNLYLNFA